MAPARPIALLTDFGGDDFYAGVMRAVAATASPGSRLIDLSHGIAPHAVAQASFVLARAIDFLPDDAVVAVVVDPGVGGDRRGIVIEYGNRVLVGPDNGFASDVVARESPRRVVVIDDVAAASLGARPRGTTFHGRDVFAPVAAAVARGVPLSELGPEVAAPVQLAGVPSVSIAGARVSGTGRWVDRFGNVLTDIPGAALSAALAAPAAVAAFVNGRGPLALRRTYVDGAPGELFCLVNGWGLIEAAVNGGSASAVLSLRRPENARFELHGG